MHIKNQVSQLPTKKIFKRLFLKKKKSKILLLLLKLTFLYPHTCKAAKYSRPSTHTSHIVETNTEAHKMCK